MSKNIVFIFLIFMSCNEIANKDCLFQDKTIDGRIVNIRGCMKNSLEYGHWVHSDSIGNIIKEGNYDNGILTGVWKYNLRDKMNLSVKWEKYENKKFSIYTNIPSILSKVQEGDFFLRFDKPDTLKELTLVIAIHDTSEISLPLEKYYKQSEKEISERGWTFRRQTTELESDGNVFYMNLFQVSKEKEKRFIWNSYGPIENGKILEITTNYDISNDALGRIVFTSVCSNIFVNGRRYLYPYKSMN